MRYLSIVILLLTSLTISAQEQMPSFELQDKDGKIFKSSSLEGNKYVLLDFWASWCGPCHKKFPELKELYKEYHSKGLEIVGISTDFKKEAWLSDLKKLDLPWIQLLDKTGKESVATNKFGVRAVPALILVGSDGKILACNPSMEEIRNLID